MNESKIDLCDRLRRAGLWDIASLVRDDVRTQLREQGASRRDANRQAWEVVSDEFSGRKLARRLVLVDCDWAEFPPSIESDRVDAQKLSAIWWATGYSFARLRCWAVGDFGLAAQLAFEMATKASDGVRELAEQAAKRCPVSVLLEVAKPFFRGLAVELAGGDQPTIREEIVAVLRTIDEIGHGSLQEVFAVD